ncbi:MAG TPA: tyrosine-type recombinase/integrase [Candidatus Xenobia bacterium]
MEPDPPNAPNEAPQNAADVYLGRLAPRSRARMVGILDNVARLLGAKDSVTCDWAALRYEKTQRLRTALARRYAPATANLHIAAVKGALQEAWRLGLMTAEEYHRAADLKTVRGQRLPKGRALTPEELAALFQVCRRDCRPAGARDLALLVVLYGGGLRRSEAVALDVRDYEARTGGLTVQRGKGNKARIVYVESGRDQVGNWLDIRGRQPGPLFTAMDRAGQVTARRLSDSAIRVILLHRAAEAGVAHFSPHDMRRTFIGNLLDAGADISTVQQLAGHANVQTTAKYDRRGEATKRKVARLLEMPGAEP